MAQIGKTMNGHVVLLAFLYVLLQVCVEGADHLKLCKTGTWHRSQNVHTWRIPSANCFSEEAVVVIRLDKVYLACDAPAHGYITISEFPSKRLCRLRNGTCFIFANSAVSRRPLPFVKNCSEGQYWTFADDISSINVDYDQAGKVPELEQTLELTYVVYIFGAPETPIGFVLSIVLGCIVLILLVALILVIRSRKKLVKRQRRSSDIAYSALKRESVHPHPSSEREVVVNQLYGMSRRDERSQNGIK